jgi:uncharacterized protein VirK/YbjX
MRRRGSKESFPVFLFHFREFLALRQTARVEIRLHNGELDICILRKKFLLASHVYSPFVDVCISHDTRHRELIANSSTTTGSSVVSSELPGWQESLFSPHNEKLFHHPRDKHFVTDRAQTLVKRSLKRRWLWLECQ